MGKWAGSRLNPAQPLQTHDNFYGSERFPTVSAYSERVQKVFWPERDGPEQLTQFVIYDHPADCPTGYVVRQWIIRQQPAGRVPEPVMGLALQGPTLEAVRSAVPPDKVCIGRMEGDDPTIIEVWT